MSMTKSEEQNKIVYRLLLLAMIFAFGGVFGFIYEELFYRVDLGYWEKRGSTFGPWIPIYGFGALLIVISTAKLRRKPVLLFLTATAVCGILEFATGWVLLHFFNTRLWDYNVEMWNWGNIGGYICLRSVAFFGVSALFLQYVVVPLLDKLSQRCNTYLLRFAALLPGVLFLLDMLIFGLCGMKR